MVIYWKRTGIIFLMILFITFITVGTVRIKANEINTLLINEVMSSNASCIQDEDGDYPDWIEIYNASNTSIDLSGYGLSDKKDEPYKWIFPNIILDSGKHKLIFASGKDKTGKILHTNFKINRDGETIYLSDRNGNICDSINTEIPNSNISLGRYPDGETVWAFFMEPTPGTYNSTDGFLEITQNVEVSHPGGFYQNHISIEFNINSPNAEIHYTLDGSEPMESSASYIEPIQIHHTTVVRARAFQKAFLPSSIITHTYFINETIHLPVISLSSNPDNLFDKNSGVYSADNNYNDLGQMIGENFLQDWERPVHIEFFEPNGEKGFSIDAGFKIHGARSRYYPQKSLAIFFRGIYGYNEIKYPLFPEIPITNFKSFIIRNSGSDWKSTLIRDALMHSLVEDIDLDIQAYRPAVVYINGQYWGIHNIREKQNEDYLASHHNIDPENVDILESENRVIEGDNKHYLAMIKYITSHDMNNTEHYEYVKTQMDIDNFINYQVAQIYFCNEDWPGKNIKFWRPRADGGKWRWILFDTDNGFSLSDINSYKHNTLERVTQLNWPKWPHPPWSTFLLRKLLENSEFRNAFITRFSDYLNTIFSPDTVVNNIEFLSNSIEPEMTHHQQRWNEPNDWNTNIQVLRDFANNRTDCVFFHIQNKFKLGNLATVTINIPHPERGIIKVNNVVIDEYLWKGTYFTGFPLQLTALPKAGYVFSGWRGITSSDTSMIKFDLKDDLAVTAIFEENIELPQNIIFNEINYNSSDNNNSEDWIELYNPNNFPVDISGWTFKDGDDSHVYYLPVKSYIDANDYCVICRDTVSFCEVFPEVDNYIGEFGFGLSDDGELIRLLDEQGSIVDSLSYGVKQPWPENPNGQGSTLSLKEPYIDNSSPWSWASSKGNGTPGESNLSSNIEAAPSNQTPIVHSLEQNYPNPFNQSTTIEYELPQKSQIELILYNISGQQVEVLKDCIENAGRYSVQWNAEGIPSGIYFYTLSTKEHKETKKMLYIQ